MDIETVVDEALIPPDWPAEKFPKGLWHKVVSIAVVDARFLRVGGVETLIVEDCRSIGNTSDQEEDLLSAFWLEFASVRPRLVTWNGRSFDTQVLRLRAVMHGIDASAWYAGPSRWEGYGQRFSPAWHCDVMEFMSDHGAAARLSLQEISLALGLPGKIGGSGGSVAAMMAAGRVDAVRAYCEIDTLLTLVVYMHWSAATGVSSRAALNDGLDALEAHLDAHRAARPHLGLFRDGWRRGGLVFAPAPAFPAPRRPRPIAVAKRANCSSPSRCRR